MEYDTILYVDSVNGNDTTGNGSELNPYKTLLTCASKLRTGSNLVNISEGEHRVTKLLDLVPLTKGISVVYMGKGISTLIKVAERTFASNSDSTKKFTLCSCVVTPTEGSTMTIMLERASTSDGGNFWHIFHNVVFLKGNSQLTHFSKGAPAYYTRLQFYNCTFIGADVDIAGLPTYSACVTTQSNGKTGITTGRIFNDRYLIINNYDMITNENSSYGVYTGQYAWPLYVCLLKHDNLYYSIMSIFYDTSTKEYIPLPEVDFSYKFTIDKLFEEVTLNGETFKPIDKFDTFSLVFPTMLTSYYVNISAIKSNKELIIQQFDINTSLFDNIDKLLATVTELGESYIRFVFSKDMGDTWATIVDGNVEYTDCIIPKKRYQDFTSEDIFYFNAAKNTIDEVGFSATVLTEFDWSSINPEKLRFAYVISTQDYSNNASLREISITYDENGYFQEMKDSECDIETFNHSIKIKSKISSPLIQTNIII